MNNFLRGILIALALLVATPQFALAQLADIPGFDKVLAQLQRSLDGDCVQLDEAVEMAQGDMRVYADTVQYCVATNRMIATGNVLGAATTILESNLMGHSCGRVCPVDELCVGACVLGAEHRDLVP